MITTKQIKRAVFYDGEMPGYVRQYAAAHARAIEYPRAGFERAIVSMLTGWLEYAEAHHKVCESGIGDDGVLGEAWQEIGKGLRELLNGELYRLDAGTLDGILCDALIESGLKESEV